MHYIRQQGCVTFRRKRKKIGPFSRIQRNHHFRHIHSTSKSCEKEEASIDTNNSNSTVTPVTKELLCTVTPVRNDTNSTHSTKPTELTTTSTTDSSKEIRTWEDQEQMRSAIAFVYKHMYMEQYESGQISLKSK